jgi:signal transduction histidine kinase
VLSALTIVVTLAPESARSAENDQKQVLVVYSTRRDTQAAIVGDREMPGLLERGLKAKVDYYSEHIDLARFADSQYEAAFRDYLELKYRGRRFDLVIAMEDAAFAFVAAHRAELFADSPVVFQVTRLPGSPVPDATGLVTELDFRPTLTLARQLQPDTTQVFVVGGSSARDKIYEERARTQFRSFEPGLAFTYLSDLSAVDLERRIATLPERSIVFYLLRYQDTAGENLNPIAYLDRLAAIANRPIYSWVDSTMNHGVVGGSLITQEARVEAVAGLAVRVLHGERAGSIAAAKADVDVRQVDSRQLQRWGISEALVPAGTRILFREPSVWERYRRYVLVAIAFVLAQSALIAGLLFQGTRRRQAEESMLRSEAQLRVSYEQIRDLGGRLLTAQEAERGRIARELHDDLGQQIAVLQVDIAMLHGLSRRGGVAAKPLEKVVDRIETLAKSVHHLSHRLHPATLGLIGLESALRGLQDDFANSGVAVRFTADAVPSRTLPDDCQIALFRVVQEAVSNAVKHSAAPEVLVDLRGSRDGLMVTVTDAGIGFDVAARWGKGLGLISMRERLGMVGATLNIRSAPGKGTRLEIVVPARLAQAVAV